MWGDLDAIGAVSQIVAAGAAKAGRHDQGALLLGAPPTHIAQCKEDMTMRTAYDFSPLYRSSIGFDRVFNLLDDASKGTTVDNWPPYDIAKFGDDEYRITVAVAGFSRSDLSMTQEQNLLMVTGQKSEEAEGEYLHRGIAGRAFERRFQLADHVKVTAATLKDGLLTIELRREIPEEMKPRRIEIAGDRSAPRIERSAVDAEAKHEAA